MAEFKGSKGKWERVLLEKTDFSTRRNEIQFGNDGECVAEFVHNDYDALLISKAPEMLEMLQKIVLTTESFEVDFKDFRSRYNNEIKELIKQATEI
jgi:uncharacterized protein YbgA (DUF1722 family)